MAWTEVVTALSTALIALTMLGVAAAAIILLRETRRLLESVERVVRTLEHDARPALEAARSGLEQAEQILKTARREMDAVAETSQDLRRRVTDLANAVEERLLDAETLIDVVYDELEDTALDVAAALRATRRGGSVLRAVKRAVLGRGR